MSSVDQTSGSGSGSKAKVVIVGAGIAGVTAAARLFHNGVQDITVLEAQDYTGGRIMARVVDGNNIDFGAQFIHGQIGNPLFTIAETLGIVIDDDDDDDVLIGTAGHVHLCSNGEKVDMDVLMACLKYVEEQYNDTDPATIEENMSVKDIFQQAYDQYLVEHGANLSTKIRQVLDASYRSLCAQTNLDNASMDLASLSGWATLAYKELKGNRYTELDGGITKIFQAILGLLPDGIIQTNTPVSSIKWNSGDRQGGKSTVICKSGKHYQADHVIVTTSVSYLKENLSTMFEPSLPSSFTTVLTGLETGATGKVYLQWESPFWKQMFPETEVGDTSIIFDFLWLESSPVTLSSDRSKRKTQLGRSWWEGMPGCETTTSHDCMLELWFLWDQVEVLEQLSDEEVMSVLYELLQVFFNDRNIPTPIAVYRSMWLSNPYIKGSYTYPTTSFRRSYTNTLSRPLPSVEDPRLQFAGEAFSLETIGGAHGAHQSGHDAADRILSSRGIDVCRCSSVSDLVQRNKGD